MESFVFRDTVYLAEFPSCQFSWGTLRLQTSEYREGSMLPSTPQAPTWDPLIRKDSAVSWKQRITENIRRTRLKFWLKNSKCPVSNSCSNRLVSPREFLESFKLRPDRIRAALQGIAWMTSWICCLRFQKPVTKALLTQCSLLLGA